MSRKFSISEGDTPDWVRVDFETFSDNGKKILALFKLSIDGRARTFDMRRKCWFVSAQVIEPLKKGMKALFNTPAFLGWEIEDVRMTEEAFEDFFVKEIPVITTSKVPKAELIKQLEFIVKERAKILITIREDVTLDEAKSAYRKAARALHPDLNPANAQYMSELNKVWADLQRML